MSLIRETGGILYKEFKSEMRTGYTFSPIVIFSVIGVIISNFALGGLLSNPQIFAMVYWLIIFFTAMNALPRSFISDEETGVSILLRLNGDSLPIYLGKFIYNFLTNIISAIAAGLSLYLASGIVIAQTWVLIANIILVCLCFSAGSTILSAIIAKSSKKASLLPILAFPVLIPIIYLGIDITSQSLVGNVSDYYDAIFLLMYSAVLISVSVILFDFVWYE